MALDILYSCPLSAGFQHALLLSGRCIPDVSLERDVLHIHLLLYHLLLSSFLKNNFVYLFTFDCTGSSLLHGLCSRGGAQPFHCGGFSCGARAPGCASSGVVSQRPRCSVTCGILPDQGSNLSPSLAGKFFTIEPPGKPLSPIFNQRIQLFFASEPPWVSF